MQVKIDAKKLNEVLKVFAVIIPKSSNLTALTYLKLEAVEDRLILSGTDLETYLKCEFPAETTNQTAQAVCLPFHKFKQYVSKKKGDLLLTLDSEKVGVGDAVFFELLDVEDFPAFPSLPEDFPLSFEAEELAEALNFCLPYVTTEEARFILSGVYFELPCQNEPPLVIDHPVARLVATDGHRLAMVDTNFKGSIEGKLEAIVPKVGIATLLKLLKRTAGPIYLNCSDGHLYAKTGTWEIGIKLIEGQYPDYRAVIPKKGLRAIFDAKEMFEALTELESLRTDKYAGIRCTFESDRIDLTLKQKNSSSSKMITSQYRGPRVSLYFNVRYLIDALKGRSGKVIFSFGYSNTPAVMQYGNDLRNIALIMPISFEDDEDEIGKTEIPEEVKKPLPTAEELKQYRLEVTGPRRKSRGRKCTTCRRLREENKLLREEIEFLQAQLQKTHLEAEGEAVNAAALAQEVEELRRRVAELKAENESLLEALKETEKCKQKLDEIRARQERELQLVREELRSLAEQAEQREYPTIPLRRLPEGGAVASIDGMVVYFRDGRILRPNGNGGEPVGRYDKLLGLGKIGDRVVHLKSSGNGWVLEILK